MPAGTLLTGAFVNDNVPPHHAVVQGLSGNFEAGIISLTAPGYVGGLTAGQRYYVGSDQQNFPNSRFTGFDGTYLQFRYP